MRLSFATRELERLCTEERYMRRKLGHQVAKALQLRIAELRYCSDFPDLRSGTGRWEELRGDRQGTWSARLTANWRLIVGPSDSGVPGAVVVEIVDYHGS